tara:strand:+ start:419 stop:850 length:432 start_codon:yes stop_codon:yes gene_type:complete
MNIFYIIIIILFIIACSYSAYIYFQNYKKKMNDRKFIENGEFFKNKKIVNSELYLFYTKWCPHCKTALKTWKQIENDSTFDKYKINLFKINCDDKEHKTIVKDFNITEYPTIVLLLNDKKYIYDTNLQKESLERFILAVYQKQ